MKIRYIFFAVLVLVGISVFYFGEVHSKQQAEIVSAQAVKYNNEQKSEEQKQIDAAKKTWLGKIKPDVYVIGSSVAAGYGSSDSTKTSWAGLLNQSFLKTNPDVSFTNLGVGGYTTQDIISNHILNNIIAPDVVIFETCLLNNYTKYTINQSEMQIKSIYDTLHKNNPNAKIILMPSDPPAAPDLSKSVDNYTYREYVSNIGQYIKSQGWDYIDFWGTYENTVKSKGYTLKSVLKDNVHPIDIGYKIWFDSIKGHFGISN